MKIMVCHNSYQQLGGEDSVVAAEIALLKSYDHNVYIYTVTNDEIDGAFKKIKTGLNAAYSKTSKDKFSQVLLKFKPDIVHFHNIFPLMTPSVYDACAEHGIAVVQTLHNYRNICSAALLLRDGKDCDLCINGSSYQAVRHKCYRNSYLQTFAVSRMIAKHRNKNTWQNKVNRYIVPSESAGKIFIRANFPERKISVKPHFVSVADPEVTTVQSFALFVGRISAEKGVKTLIKAFNKNAIPLKIIGDGPLKTHFESSSASNIQWLGSLPHEQVYAYMRQAQFLIMPSECRETFGMTVIEAFANMLPVLCSNIGALPELVVEDKTGLHFEAGDAKELSAKAKILFGSTSKCELMGNEARVHYEKYFTAERNYGLLMQIYTQAITDSQNL